MEILILFYDLCMSKSRVCMTSVSSSYGANETSTTTDETLSSTAMRLADWSLDQHPMIGADLWRNMCSHVTNHSNKLLQNVKHMLSVVSLSLNLRKRQFVFAKLIYCKWVQTWISVEYYMYLPIKISAYLLYNQNTRKVIYDFYLLIVWGPTITFLSQQYWLNNTIE